MDALDERSASHRKIDHSKSFEKNRIRPSSIVTTTSSSKLTKSSTCCYCFGPLKNQWNDGLSGQMSDVYCRACDIDIDADNEDNDDDDEHFIHIPKDRLNSPAILANVTKAKQILSKHSNQQSSINGLNVKNKFEITKSTNEFDMDLNAMQSLQMHDTTTTTSTTTTTTAAKTTTTTMATTNKLKSDEFELGDDVATHNESNIMTNKIDYDKKLEIMNAKEMIRVHGKEEFPASSTSSSSPPPLSSNDKKHVIDNEHLNINLNSKPFIKHLSHKTTCTDDHPLLIGNGDNIDTHTNFITTINERQKAKCDYLNGNGNDNDIGIETVPKSKSKSNIIKQMHRIYSTLPKVKKSTFIQRTISVSNGPPYSIPSRITPDGTTIYYLCDLNKQILKELDDGAYNPLWTSKGFTQTFHFWKEHRRQQSIPLNAFLTYVTLPWWSIAKDLLDHRETPILTF